MKNLRSQSLLGRKWHGQDYNPSFSDLKHMLWKIKHIVSHYKINGFEWDDVYKVPRASLVAQWLRIRPPRQGTRVRALVQEDPTCRGATKPECHNYWACALEPTSHNYWAHAPQLLKPARLEPVLRNKRGHRNEKPAHRNKEQPLLAATRESPCAATKTQCSQK